MARYRFTILGCGSSGGVPRIGNRWGACNPANPRNRRRRCSLLAERIGSAGITRVLIDTSPDMREQLLDAGVGTLDAVAWTHAHADHVHGIDDLRQVVFNLGRRLEVWADGPTSEALLDRFGYAFVQPEGSPYPAILDLHLIEGPFTVHGAGGPVELRPFRVRHGGIDALGFRIGNVAYLPDVSAMTTEAWDAVAGLDCWILDALRYRPHPTHAHLDLALEWIARARPRRAVITNMHYDIDHAAVSSMLPARVVAAYDMMRIESTTDEPDSAPPAADG